MTTNELAARICEVVGRYPSGLSYDELRAELVEVDDALVNRSIVRSLRNAELDIVGGLFRLRISS